MKSHVLAVVLVGASLGFVHCGGSPASQPTPLPAATPNPTPAPTPTPKPLSVIRPCALPASNPGAGATCTDPKSRLSVELNAAIDRVINERPDLFDLDNVDGGPRILDTDAYMTGVVAAINEAGLCGHLDAEGEIGIKSSNSFNEQWIIVSKAGWSSPPGHWVRRKYVGACAPSVF